MSSFADYKLAFGFFFYGIGEVAHVAVGKKLVVIGLGLGCKFLGQRPDLVIGGVLSQSPGVGRVPVAVVTFSKEVAHDGHLCDFDGVLRQCFRSRTLGQPGSHAGENLKLDVVDVVRRSFLILGQIEGDGLEVVQEATFVLFAVAIGRYCYLARVVSSPIGAKVACR